MTEVWTRENVDEKLLQDLKAKGELIKFLKDSSKWNLKQLQTDGGCNIIFLISDETQTLLIKWVKNVFFLNL
jgi:hypothetical protein